MEKVETCSSCWTRPLKLGQIGCPETSVLNQATLRSNPEDGSLRSCNEDIVLLDVMKQEYFLVPIVLER